MEALRRMAKIWVKSLSPAGGASGNCLERVVKRCRERWCVRVERTQWLAEVQRGAAVVRAQCGPVPCGGAARACVCAREQIRQSRAWMSLLRFASIMWKRGERAVRCGACERARVAERHFQLKQRRARTESADRRVGEQRACVEKRFTV